MLQPPEEVRSRLRRPNVPGPLLCARYASAPNRLGYCGPAAADELVGELETGPSEPALRHLAAQFEGAFPYLELIARANGIADPLDRGVVEAYWLGNDLLRRVGPGALDRSLRERFWKRLDDDSRRWIGGKPSAGALPNHAFHVLDLLPRMGLLRAGRVDRVLETMDACRIRWGRVLARHGNELTVVAPRLELTDGKLALTPPREESVSSAAGDEFNAGDTIAIHWGWACDRLDARRLASLERSTATQLVIANQTI
jgi:hypothetical protein